ncbi:unnamed protein product [Sympodiomycopsis kandeliae]
MSPTPAAVADMTSDHEVTMQAFQHDSFDTQDAFASFQRRRVAEKEFDRLMKRVKEDSPGQDERVTDTRQVSQLLQVQSPGVQAGHAVGIIAQKSLKGGERNGYPINPPDSPISTTVPLLVRGDSVGKRKESRPPINSSMAGQALCTNGGESPRQCRQLRQEPARVVLDKPISLGDDTLIDKDKIMTETRHSILQACGLLLGLFCTIDNREGVNGTLPVLFVIGVVLSGPLSLIQALFTSDGILLVPHRYRATHSSSTIPSTDSEDMPTSTVEHAAAIGCTSVKHTTNKSGSSLDGDNHSRSQSTFSYSNISVASIPYQSDHWRAGEVVRDQVLKPRSPWRRTANMLDPKPVLDVLPDEIDTRDKGSTGTWLARARRKPVGTRQSAENHHISPLRINKVYTDMDKANADWESEFSGDEDCDEHHGLTRTGVRAPTTPRKSPSSWGSPGTGRNDFKGTHHTSHQATPEMSLPGSYFSPDKSSSVMKKIVNDGIGVGMSPDVSKREGSKWALDGLSAMLLPHIAPGVRIGADVPVVEDDERNLIDQFEEHRSKLAQGKDWWSLRQDQRNVVDSDEAVKHNSTPASSKPANISNTSSRRSPFKNLLLSSRLQRRSEKDSSSAALDLSSSLLAKKDSNRVICPRRRSPFKPIRRTVLQRLSPAEVTHMSSDLSETLPCDERAVGHTARVGPATPARKQYGAVISQLKQRALRASSRRSSPVKSSHGTAPAPQASSLASFPPRTSSLLAPFPAGRVSSHFAMLENSAPAEKLKYAAVAARTESFKRCDMVYEGRRGSLRSHTKEDATDRKLRSSISKTILNSVRPSGSLSHSLEVQRSQVDAADAPRQDQSTDETVTQTHAKDPNLTLEDLSMSLSADGLDTSASRVAPSESTPTNVIKSVPRLMSSLACVSREQIVDFKTPASVGNISSRQPSKWTVLPESIPLPVSPESQMADQSVSRIQTATLQASGTIDLSPKTEIRRLEEPHASPIRAALVNKVADEQAPALTLANVARATTNHASKEHPLTITSVERDAPEDSEAGLVETLPHSTLEAFAKQAVTTWRSHVNASSGTHVVESCTEVQSGLENQQDLLSPVSACFSSASSEKRRSLGSSLGLDQEVQGSQPVPRESLLVPCAHEISERRSVSPSCASSTSRRRSLGSEFGMSEAIMTNDTQQQTDQGQAPQKEDKDVTVEATSTADKRSTGGTITTITTESCLSSELVLSPVGSGSLKSPQSPNKTAAPPESPLRRFVGQNSVKRLSPDRGDADTARQSGTSGQPSTKPLDLRKLKPLELFVYQFEEVQGRLPTVTECSEEASRSVSRAASELHHSPRRNAIEWQEMSHQIGKICQAGSAASTPSNKARHTSLAMSSPHSAANYGVQGKPQQSRSTPRTIRSPSSPSTLSLSSPGWLLATERQSSFVSVQARTPYSTMQRNLSTRSRASAVGMTPRGAIGLRSEFWQPRNDPLPPLPFDIVAEAMTDRTSTLSYLDEDDTLAELSQDQTIRPMDVHSLRSAVDRLDVPNDSQCDTTLQDFDIELIDNLDEWQRISAEQVRNSPERPRHHLGANDREKRKSRISSTVSGLRKPIKARQSVSSLLGLGPTKNQGSRKSSAQSVPWTEGDSNVQATRPEQCHKDDQRESTSASTQDTSDWTRVSQRDDGSSSMSTVQQVSTPSETFMERAALEAQLEDVLRRHAEKMAQNSKRQEAEVHVEDTTPKLMPGGVIPRPHAKLPEDGRSRYAHLGNQPTVAPGPRPPSLALGPQTPEDVVTLPYFDQSTATGVIRLEPRLSGSDMQNEQSSGRDASLPSQRTLHARNQSYVSTDAASSQSFCSEMLSVTISEWRQVKVLQEKAHIKTERRGAANTAVLQPVDPNVQPLLAYSNSQSAKEAWPSTTPARARRLSELPDVAGACQMMLAMSPKCESQSNINGTHSDSVQDGAKRRCPRLREAHLVQTKDLSMSSQLASSRAYL